MEETFQGKVSTVWILLQVWVYATPNTTMILIHLHSNKKRPLLGTPKIWMFCQNSDTSGWPPFCTSGIKKILEKEREKDLLPLGDLNPQLTHINSHRLPCALTTDPRRHHTRGGSNSWFIYFLRKSSRASYFFWDSILWIRANFTIFEMSRAILMKLLEHNPVVVRKNFGQKN